MSRDGPYIREMRFITGNQNMTTGHVGCICLLQCILCVCVLAVYYKAQAQRISNREFKHWTFLQGTESRVATFLAETCVMSHQSLTQLLQINRDINLL